MMKRRTTWLVLGAILAVAVIAWLVMPAKQEARYEGKTVKEWFYAIPVTNLGASGYVMDTRGPHFPAIRVLKKEAVPFLLDETRKADSKLHYQLFSWFSTLSAGRIMDDNARRIRISGCFQQLGPEACKSAIPELTEMALTARPGALSTELLLMIAPEAAAKAGIKNGAN